MAKYKSKMYAAALANSLADKKVDDKKISANFLKLLQKNGDTKKSSQVIALAEKLLLKKVGNKKVILEMARKVDAGDVVKSFVKKGDVVQEKINPGIVAGMKIIVDGDKQLDLSLLKKLENIF